MHPKLKEFQNLESNWDGEGANSISLDAIQMAQATFDASDFEIHHIAPMPSGGIQLEHYNDSFQVEIEFTPNGEIALLINHEDTYFEAHIPNNKTFAEPWTREVINGMWNKYGLQNDDAINLTFTISQVVSDIHVELGAIRRDT